MGTILEPKHKAAHRFACKIEVNSAGVYMHTETVPIWCIYVPALSIPMYTYTISDRVHLCGYATLAGLGIV